MRINSAVTRLCCLGFLLLPLAARADNIELAVTMDGFPEHIENWTEQTTVMKKLIQILSTRGVNAVHFIAGTSYSRKQKFFEELFAEGHRLANHTLWHRRYSALSLPVFRAEVILAEDMLGKWYSTVKYFRPPFFDYGDTGQKRRDLCRVLTELDYTLAPATIILDDDTFNDRYLEALARRDQAAVERILADYLSHIDDRSKKALSDTRRRWRRPVKQIIDIHANLLNARTLEHILDRYKAQGWHFISIEEALKDPIYTAEYCGRWMTPSEPYTTRPETVSD